MKKIPTIFERDWDGNPGLVLDKPNPAADWVFRGEGQPTQKIDGTSCMIKDGKLYKRYEARSRLTIPVNFIEADHDEKTDRRVGWVPVGNRPEDKWHREAFVRNMEGHADGTYELIGPKVQSNPENHPAHDLISHTSQLLKLGVWLVVPTDFEGLRDYLSRMDIEGIVWHHPDGRMAKIKKRDFGLRRKPQPNEKEDL